MVCTGPIVKAVKHGEPPLSLSVTQPTSFGADALDRIYLTTVGGSGYRLDPAAGQHAQ